MKTRLLLAAATLRALLVAAPPALPCSLCGGLRPRPTLRQDAASAKLVLYGKMTNAKLDAASDTGGTTDLQIEKTLKSDPWLGEKKVVQLPRYVRIDPKNDQYLIICDIFK